jgi:hypothetical protein
LFFFIIEVGYLLQSFFPKSFSLLKNVAPMFFLVCSSLLLVVPNSHAFEENIIGQLDNAVKKAVASAEPSEV